ncbi:MAG: MDR family MFS transporter [Acidimicrobiia bacterium]
MTLTEPTGAAATTEAETALDRRRIRMILAGLILGSVIAGIDMTVLTVGLPTIAADLGHIDLIAWVLTAYVLTQTAVTPIYGKLGDLYGRKRLFQVAIISFLVGSVLCALSQTMIELIVFRAVQGIGGGGLIVLSQAIIGDIVSPSERPRYQAIIQAINALAIIAGPPLGGLLIDHLSWHWIFYINVPIGIVAVAVVGIGMPKSPTGQRHVIDYLGATLLTASLTLILLAGTLGGSELTWGSPQIIAMISSGTVLLILFMLQERRTPEPILPLEIFRFAVVRVTSFLNFTNSVVLIGLSVYLPLLFQMVLGLSPGASGTVVAPGMLSSMIVAILVGRYIGRTGRYKIIPILAFAMMGVAMVLFTTTSIHTSQITIMCFQAVFGLSFGAGQQVLMLAVQNTVDHRHLGVATSAANLFRSLGSVVGTAVFGIIVNARFRTELKHFLPSGVTLDKSTVASPTKVKALEPVLRDAVRNAYVHSIRVLFIVSIGIAVVCVIGALFLKEEPLRTTIKSERELAH